MKVILILLFKNISHQKIIHYGIAVDHKGYIINSSQQIVEQIKVVQQKVLPEVFKLINTVLKNNNEFLCSFPLKKDSRKIKFMKR